MELLGVCSCLVVFCSKCVICSDCPAAKFFAVISGLLICPALTVKTQQNSREFTPVGDELFFPYSDHYLTDKMSLASPQSIVISTVDVPMSSIPQSYACGPSEVEGVMPRTQSRFVLIRLGKVRRNLDPKIFLLLWETCSQESSSLVTIILASSRRLQSISLFITLFNNSILSVLQQVKNSIKNKKIIITSYSLAWKVE